MSQFDFEAEMLVPVNQWLQDKGYKTKDEYSLPWGICDLVGVKFDPENVQRRIELAQKSSVTSAEKIYLLNAIPDIRSKRSISPELIEQKLNSHYDRETITKNLRYLEKGKFVRKNSRGKYQKFNGWAPLVSDVVAIELKLSRINEVLNQTMRHRYFARHVYAALPMNLVEGLIENSRILSKFERAGIGLLGVSKTAVELALESSKQSTIDNILLTQAGERFWRQAIDEYEATAKRA